MRGRRRRRRVDQHPGDQIPFGAWTLITLTLAAP
jgi:hypothetical protein